MRALTACEQRPHIGSGRLRAYERFAGSPRSGEKAASSQKVGVGCDSRSSNGGLGASYESNGCSRSSAARHTRSVSALAFDASRPSEEGGKDSISYRERRTEAVRSSAAESSSRAVRRTGREGIALSSRFPVEGEIDNSELGAAKLRNGMDWTTSGVCGYNRDGQTESPNSRRKV